MVFEDPALTEDSVHDRVTLEVLGVAVNVKVPVEDGLCLSPE
jgi:hypothetical protein